MADPKRDIAELLKTQRENLGLSIDEIFERTRIDTEFLKAFEDGDFDVLPRAYARLFLKTYARELDLDARDILTRFEKIAITSPARATAQTPPKHRLNFRLSSLLLIACVLIIAAVIVLNIRQNTESTAPVDTVTSQPPVAQPPAEIQPTPQDSAQQTDDSTPTQSDIGQTIPPSESEADAASQSENREMLTPGSETNSAASPSENREGPSPARSDTGQIIPPSESEADAASQPANQEMPTPESETNSVASQSENRETLTPGSETNSEASPSENREGPTPARSDTSQRTPSESETSTASPSPEPEEDAASPSENREGPSPGRDPEVFVPSASDVLTAYNLPLPVVIADDDLMILSCVATETTTLSITADGRDLFAGILPGGNAQRWQARDHFQVYVPRAGAISLSLQDAPLETASPPDRGLRLNISRTFIRVEELGE